MWGGEKLFLNLLVVLTASLYWFSSDHMAPALMGYFIVLLGFFKDRYDVLALLLAIVALLLMVYYFVDDFYFESEVSDFAKFGFSILYMGVIYFKSRSVYDQNDL